MPPLSHDAYIAHDLDPLPPVASLDMQHFLKKSQSLEAFEDRRGIVHVDAGLVQHWQGGRGASMGYKFTSSEVPSGFHMATRPLDLTLYVGKNRTPYVLSVESLKGSAYFRSILERRAVESSSPVTPVVIDCEEAIFHHMMTVMRYGSFEALPKLSDVEVFKLKKELEFYGIQVMESPQRMAGGRSGSRASSPTASKANTQHFSVADLPDFPVDLVDPAKLVLVSCLEDDVGRRCPCTADDKPSQWALNFHYRHAFCTGCGRPPSELAPKFLAEMFMVAASYYCGSDQINPKKWFVGCDSTCTLKFLSSKAYCCSCLCSTQTMWAVSAYHSHAFCTHCGECAEGSALVCILLASRYGGHHHRSPKGRRDHYAEVPSVAEAPTVRSAASKTATHGVH